MDCAKLYKLAEEWEEKARRAVINPKRTGLNACNKHYSGGLTPLI